MKRYIVIKHPFNSQDTYISEHETKVGALKEYEEFHGYGSNPILVKRLDVILSAEDDDDE